MPSPNLSILYDEPQEASWFKSLHPDLEGVLEVPISAVAPTEPAAEVLVYDRPDVVLLDDEHPILVVEQTIEVPSGHNVGQRFARLAAAAESGVPVLYFGPYVAMKHGGKTAGPRYVNARLFHALDALIRVTGSAATTINWPVDEAYEIRRDPEKDRWVREYLEEFLRLYNVHGRDELNRALLESALQKELLARRDRFVREQINNPDQYLSPPDSVKILTPEELGASHGLDASELAPLAPFREVILYRIGMKRIRSDPYTGMAMLYHYLYKAEHRGRGLVLWFPEVTYAAWNAAADGSVRKDIRLFSHVADAILFKDRLLPAKHL